jgi:biopolymer transport protein TolR
MLQQGLEVDLPETSTQPLRMTDEPLVLTVKKDGSYHLASVQVPIEELGPKLTAIFEGRDDKEIFLRADQDAPYGVVVKAMAAARLAGARSLGIVTEPE